MGNEGKSGKKWTPAIVEHITKELLGKEEKCLSQEWALDRKFLIEAAQAWLNGRHIDVMAFPKPMPPFGDRLIPLYDIFFDGKKIYAGYDQMCLHMLIGMGIMVEYYED